MSEVRQPTPENPRPPEGGTPITYSAASRAPIALAVLLSTLALLAATALTPRAHAAANYPVDGPHRYTSAYGEDRGTYYHRGTDIAADEGTPLRAVSSGRVAYRQYQSGGAGYYVVIHGWDGRDSVYMHMREAAYVAPGTTVSAGQLIGRVGSTGHSSGPHLHFELWTPHWYDGGHDYDPSSLLGKWDVPAPPKDLTAARGDGRVSLDWAPVNESDLVGYRVYRRTVNGEYQKIASTGSSSFVDTTASSNAAYYYRVKAVDGMSNVSYWSNYATVGDGEAAARDAYEQIVDNSDPTRFSASSSWSRGTYNTQRRGTDYRYARPKAVSDPARYRLRVPSTGSYEVYVWYPARSTYSAGAPIGVKTTEGLRWHRVDQRSGGGRWVSLGAHSLPAGDDWSVTASRWTSSPGYVIADAVRIVER